MSDTVPMSPAVRSPMERFLRLFGRIRAEEVTTSLLLIAAIFLILMAYYFIKPVREGWLSVSAIQGLTKLEVKAYSSFGQSLLLIIVLPLYAKLATLWPRRKLITRVGMFFGTLIFFFWWVQPGLLVDQVPYAGVAFYLVVGIFGVTLVAQFWSFAADVYGHERGKRLFPMVAVGAAAGGAFGSWIGEKLLKSTHIEAFDLLLLAQIPLFAAILLCRWVDRRGTYGFPGDRTKTRWEEPAAPSYQGAFSLILKFRYLGAAALMVLLFNWVVASGDNILFALVQVTLEEELSGSQFSQQEFDSQLKNATTAFYSSLYFWINLLSLFLQAFIVSRLVQLGGFRLLILFTPAISLVAYVSMAIAPLLSIIKIMKIAENSSNYSINNTARHMLWLPTTKEMLYQAKPTVDTLFMRIGDGMAALTVLIGTRILSLELNIFLLFNIALILCWIVVAAFISREHRRWSAKLAQ